MTPSKGVLTHGRVRLLLGKGHSCYRQRRKGERERKSVRGCIVDGNLSVLSMAIVKKGDQEIPGLTDNTIPRRLGPKRASKIRSENEGNLLLQYFYLDGYYDIILAFMEATKPILFSFSSSAGSCST